MSKHQHDREQLHRRPQRDASREHRAFGREADNEQDLPRRVRHAPYHRERLRYFDDWDAD